MTTRFIKAAFAGTVFAAAFAATGAQAATATATAKAKILSPITVTKTADLDFGTIITSGAAANVTVSTAGARTCGGTLVCTNPVTAAAFNIAGSVAAVNISSDASVSLTSGANTMSATLNTSKATSPMTGGTDSFTVGGVLSVGATQADGSYSGTFTVTVNYQ